MAQQGDGAIPAAGAFLAGDCWWCVGIRVVCCVAAGSAHDRGLDRIGTWYALYVGHVPDERWRQSARRARGAAPKLQGRGADAPAPRLHQRRFRRLRRVVRLLAHNPSQRRLSGRPRAPGGSGGDQRFRRHCPHRVRANRLVGGAQALCSRRGRFSARHSCATVPRPARRLPARRGRFWLSVCSWDHHARPGDRVYRFQPRASARRRGGGRSARWCADGAPGPVDDPGP